MRASRSGRVLDSRDAPYVKGMIGRGDRQHDIAAYFGVNGGRIGEVSTGEQFASVPPAAVNDLPPPAPYLVVSATHRAKAGKIVAALRALKADPAIIKDAEGVVDAFEASHRARRGV